MGSRVDVLRERLAEVEARLTDACRRAGRQRHDVTLVAVTKSVGVEVARLLPSLGVYDLAENRPQELWHKSQTITPSSPGISAAFPGDSPRWHLIGHLQRNKIPRTLPLVACIHSIDSLRLLETLEHEAQQQNRVLPVFLEVNVSGETSKQGFAPAEILALPDAIARLERIHVRGLMTMAPLQEPEQCRPQFARLRGLRDELASRLSAPHEMTELSMGMSNDYEIAVEEGATHVRLGTVLFGPLAA